MSLTEFSGTLLPALITLQHTTFFVSFLLAITCKGSSALHNYHRTTTELNRSPAKRLIINLAEVTIISADSLERALASFLSC